MYQQRWKNLAFDEDVPAYAIPITDKELFGVKLYRVLQYRERDKVTGYFWSEWEDVTYGEEDKQHE